MASQSHLYDFVKELLSSLQADNFEAFRANVARVSAVIEKQVVEVFEAPVIYKVPEVDIDTSSESSSVFVNREADKLNSHMTKLFSKLTARAEPKVIFPTDGFQRVYPNMLVANPSKELRPLEDVRGAFRKDLAPLGETRCVVRKEDVDNESPRKRARHKPHHSLPVLAPLQPSSKAGSFTSGSTESLSGGRKHLTPVSSSTTSPTESASGRQGKNRVESPSISQGRSVSALKKRFEASAPSCAVPNSIPSTVSEKIRMFGGKRGSMNSQVAPSPISDVAPALAVPKGRASSTCNAVPNPSPVSETLVAVAPIAAETLLEKAPTSLQESLPTPTPVDDTDVRADVEAVSDVPEVPILASKTSLSEPVTTEAACREEECGSVDKSQPVTSQTEAELPWAVMPPQPAVLVRGSGGSRSVPTFSNILKSSHVPMQQVGSLRSLTEGKSMPLCESNGKGKGKTQRRSATFVVPKEGVLCRKASDEQRLRGKQETKPTSKSPKASSPQGRGATSQLANGSIEPSKGETATMDSQNTADLSGPNLVQGKGKGRSHRRSATLGIPIDATEHGSHDVRSNVIVDTNANVLEQGQPHEGALRPVAEQVFNQSPESYSVLSPASANCTPKKTFPPVPPFKEKQALEPWLLLRQSELTSPRPEDNYEISEQGDSDPDDAADARRRAKKHVPRWCEDYLEQLSKQADTDPDSLFGSRVPVCELEEIFPSELYEKVGKARPKRNRGSSQNWGRDRLTKTEVKEYKRKMGQMKGWMANIENMPPGTQHLLAGPRRAA